LQDAKDHSEDSCQSMETLGEQEQTSIFPAFIYRLSFVIEKRVLKLMWLDAQPCCCPFFSWLGSIQAG